MPFTKRRNSMAKSRKGLFCRYTKWNICVIKTAAACNAYKSQVLQAATLSIMLFPYWGNTQITRQLSFR